MCLTYARSIHDNTNRNTVVYVSINRTIIRQYEIRLRPTDEWTKRLKLRPELDGPENVHTVTVSTIGASTNFSFDYVTRFEDPNSVKVPRITNVSVENARINGRPSAVVNVTVVNPSAQTYPTKRMVHRAKRMGVSISPCWPQRIRDDNGRITRRAEQRDRRRVQRERWWHPSGRVRGTSG